LSQRGWEGWIFSGACGRRALEKGRNGWRSMWEASWVDRRRKHFRGEKGKTEYSEERGKDRLAKEAAADATNSLCNDVQIVKHVAELSITKDIWSSGGK